MKKQDLATEANTYFEQLGLNDVVEELSEKFSQAYMIPGEETYNLKEALQRASDFLLDKIYEKIHGSKPEDLITRQQKEEILYKDIPGSICCLWLDLLFFRLRRVLSCYAKGNC